MTETGHRRRASSRKEDHRFLTGTGQYTDDINLHGQAYAVFVRSPHAHARITRHRQGRGRGHARRARIFTGEDIARPTVGRPALRLADQARTARR